MNPSNQSLPPGYSASDIVPAGGDQSQPSQTSSLPPGYSASDIVPVDNSTPPSDTSQPQSFQTPGGQTYNVGQSVQHSTGVHGEVTGQHPDTGNAVIKWHQGADQFKTGMLVRVDGHSGVVTGKSNNGKVLVDWGDKGISSVSPGDIEAPGGVGSFVAGVGNSLANTAAGAAKMLGMRSTGLDETQRQTQQSTAVNPMSGKMGELAGDLVQFLGANGIVKAGTGAVTALPAVEQYATAAKITKALADHPILARILHAGINGAIAQGGLSGVQSGGDPVAAAKGAALGGAADIGGEFAPEAARAVGGAINRGGHAAAEAVNDLPNLPGKVQEKIWPAKIETPSSVEKAQQAIQARIDTQPAYDQHASDIRKAFVDGLKNHGVDLQIPSDIDVRKVPDLAKKALENEYRPLYGKVDEALEKNGFEDKYQDLEDNVDQARTAAKEARRVADKKPEGVVSANSAVTEAKAKLAQANAILKDNGLDGAVQRASSLYKASKAADEFKTKILSHTQDFNGTLPRTDPNGFNKALNNLKYKSRYGSNRLDQLFGEKAGSQLMDDTRSAQTRVSNLANAEKLRVAGGQDLEKKASDVNSTRKTTRNVSLGVGAAVGVPALAREAIRHIVE